MNLDLKKCWDDVRSEVSNRHGSDIFETQLPIKFQPNPTTESKVMLSGSPCIILDAIGFSQEVFHSFKSKKLSTMILKLNLKKDYDMVNWYFLILVLL